MPPRGVVICCFNLAAEGCLGKLSLRFSKFVGYPRRPKMNLSNALVAEFIVFGLEGRSRIAPLQYYPGNTGAAAFRDHSINGSSLSSGSIIWGLRSGHFDELLDLLR